MSYLFPEGSTTERGVVEVGSNINVLDGVISIPQSVDPSADITFENITANSNVNVAGNVTVIGNIDALSGSISGFNLFDNTNRVITSVTPSSGDGISITSLTSDGPSASFTVNNTGVLSLTAGTGITLSGSTGNITVSAKGADLLNTIGVTSNYTATATDEYIGVNSTSLVTVTLPTGVTGRQYIIKEERGAGTGKVNVQGTGAETIDGSPFKQLTANASLSVVFRAGAWRII
jgi:hypothetical protein